MTREEAIRCLSVHSSTNGSGLCTDEQHYEAKQMAIKALEQEPCEDAIRRDAVLEKAGYTETEEGWCGYTVDVDYIKSLPPVTLQPKMGHWKFVQRGKYIDICCSKCGYQRVKEYAYNYTVDQISEQDIKDFFSNSNMNFCENCGAKMQAESENNE